jgi:tellurite resistance protein TehA-like permease
MGTAALSVAAFRLPREEGVVALVSDGVGWFLLLFALVAMVTLVVVNVVHHTPRQVIRENMRSSELGPAYAAVPGAVLTLVLAMEAASRIPLENTLVSWLLLVIVLAAAGANLWLTLVFFVAAIGSRGLLEANTLSGVWFMPQTVLLLAATALARMSGSLHGPVVEIAAPLAVLFLGVGFMLFVLVAALVLARLVVVPLDPAAGTPAAWIMMSPAAAAALAFLALPLVIPVLLTAPPMSVAFVTSLTAGALVGFSLWWLAVVVLLTIRLRSHAMQFSPSSWSFVFPLAAVAVASGELAHTWDSTVMTALAFGMAAIASVVWLAVLVGSVRWIRARVASE